MEFYILVFISSFASRASIKHVSSLKGLQKLTACQFSHWPVSDILEAVRIPIIRNTSFVGIAEQTERIYCDYFPRAIIEAKSEILAYNKGSKEKFCKYMISLLLVIHSQCIFLYRPISQNWQKT